MTMEEIKRRLLEKTDKEEQVLMITPLQLNELLSLVRKEERAKMTDEEMTKHWGKLPRNERFHAMMTNILRQAPTAEDLKSLGLQWIPEDKWESRYFKFTWSAYSKGGGKITGWGCLKKDDPGIPSVEQVAYDTAIEMDAHSVEIGTIDEVTEADYLACMNKKMEEK